MTMPHLENCLHKAGSWCLACVKELWEEKERFRSDLFSMQNESIDQTFKKLIATGEIRLEQLELAERQRDAMLAECERLMKSLRTEMRGVSGDFADGICCAVKRILAAAKAAEKGATEQLEGESGT